MVTDEEIEIGEDAERNRQLWCAVIYQAISDATGGTSWTHEGEKKAGIASARAWFRTNDPEYRQACYLAGLDPMAVRVSALQLIDEAEEAEKQNETYYLAPVRPKAATKGRPPARYTHDGETLTIVEWAQRTGKSASLIGDRLRRGWTIADAVTMSAAEATERNRTDTAWRRGPRTKTYTVDGKTMTLNQWAATINVTRRTLDNRMSKGLTLAEALNMKLYAPTARPSADQVAATDEGRGRVEAAAPKGKTGGVPSAQETPELEVFA